MYPTWGCGISPEPINSWEKCHFCNFRKKKKHDSSKERGKGSCWMSMIVSNQYLHDKFILCECRLAPLLPLPLNRTPMYAYPPTPLWTLPLASQMARSGSRVKAPPLAAHPRHGPLNMVTRRSQYRVVKCNRFYDISNFSQKRLAI